MANNNPWKKVKNPKSTTGSSGFERTLNPTERRDKRINDWYKNQADKYNKKQAMAAYDQAEQDKTLRLLADNPNREGAAGMFATLPVDKQQQFANLAGMGAGGGGRRSAGAGAGSGFSLAEHTKAMDAINAQTQSLLDSQYTPPGVVKNGNDYFDPSGNKLDESALRDLTYNYVYNQYLGKANDVISRAGSANKASDILSIIGEAKGLGLDQNAILGQNRITTSMTSPETTDIYGRTSAQAGYGEKGFRKFSDVAAGNELGVTTGDTETPAAETVGTAAEVVPSQTINGQSTSRFSAAPLPKEEGTAISTTGEQTGQSESVKDRNRTMWDLDYFSRQTQGVPSLNPKALDALDKVTPLDFVPGVGKYNPLTAVAKLVPNAISAGAEKLVNTITGPSRKVTNEMITNDLKTLNNIIRNNKGADTSRGKRMISAIEKLMKEKSLSKKQAANVLAEQMVTKLKKGRAGVNMGRL